MIILLQFSFNFAVQKIRRLELKIVHCICQINPLRRKNTSTLKNLGAKSLKKKKKRKKKKESIDGESMKN